MRPLTLILALTTLAALLAAVGFGWMWAGAVRGKSASDAAGRALVEQNDALLSFANKIARGETAKAALEGVAAEVSATPAARGDLVTYGPLVARTKGGAVEAICLAAAPAEHPCSDFVEAQEAPPRSADRKK